MYESSGRVCGANTILSSYPGRSGFGVFTRVQGICDMCVCDIIDTCVTSIVVEMLFEV